MQGLQAARLALLEPSEPINDPIAFREQMHREVDAKRRPQAELPLRSPAEE